MKEAVKKKSFGCNNISSCEGFPLITLGSISKCKPKRKKKERINHPSLFPVQKKSSSVHIRVVKISVGSYVAKYRRNAREQLKWVHIARTIENEILLQLLGWAQLTLHPFNYSHWVSSSYLYKETINTLFRCIGNFNLINLVLLRHIADCNSYRKFAALYNAW